MVLGTLRIDLPTLLAGLPAKLEQVPYEFWEELGYHLDDIQDEVPGAEEKAVALVTKAVLNEDTDTAG